MPMQLYTKYIRICYRENPLSTLANSMHMKIVCICIRGYQIEKWISRIKFDQESSKLRFSTVFIGIYIPCDANRFKTGLGRLLICPKMVKKSNVVKLCDFMVKKMDFSHQI